MTSYGVVSFVIWHLCAWRSPCSLRIAASEQAERSERPRLHARRCPRYDCLKRLRLPQAAQRAQMSPNIIFKSFLLKKKYIFLVCTYCMCVLVVICYLRLLPFGFALLWRLHLLMVIFNKARCQHVELLHPQRSGPFLRLLVCYLEQQSQSPCPQTSYSSYISE